MKKTFPMQIHLEPVDSYYEECIRFAVQTQKDLTKLSLQVISP